ncbi:MAG: flagellar export chaperone FliS [Planctomycetaceae bacterium]|nr:flagellar export chaperone FliS [Planctomycetaceae bacterium]
MAGKPPINAYLSTSVKTASKDQLLMMLFDGAIKFAHQAKAAMQVKNIEVMSDCCVKVQKIITELMSTLDADLIPPELYKNLMSLYTFCHKRMVAANIERNPLYVDEAITVINQLREVWKQAIDKVLDEFGGRLPTQDEIQGRIDGARPARSVPSAQGNGAPKSVPAPAARPTATVFQPKIQLGGAEKAAASAIPVQQPQLTPAKSPIPAATSPKPDTGFFKPKINLG